MAVLLSRRSNSALCHLMAPSAPFKVARLFSARHPLAETSVKQRLAALRADPNVMAAPTFLKAAAPAASAAEPQTERTVIPFQTFLAPAHHSPANSDDFSRDIHDIHLQRCNLRCTYCMPADGVELQPKEDLLSTSEIIRLASIFTLLGVDKIRLTGGEPLVRRDLESLCASIREECDGNGLREVAITTNGLQLARRLPGLLAAGLTGVNISLDTLQEDKFRRMTRRPGSERVLAAIHAAVQSPLPSPVKVNCVVMGGVNEEDMQPMAQLARELPLHMRFIEYMPFDDNQWDSRHGKRGGMVPYQQMLSTVMGHFPELRPADDAGRVLVGGEVGDGGHPSSHSIAKLYSAPGWAGAVGFITSMTSAFCGGCSRLRLTADGSLKVCLFGNTEVSLRDAMRGGVDDDGLKAIIRGALMGKAWSYGGHASPADIAASSNRPMILIGG